MWINLDILEDEFRNEGAIAFTKEGLELDVENVDFFTTASSISPTTAYMIDSESFTLNHTLIPVENWICCGVPSADIVPLIPGNLLILPQRTASIETLFTIEKILRKYDVWSEELNAEALRHASYKDVLAPIALRVLENPFLLFNPEDRGVILTGTLPAGFDDETTLKMIENIEAGTPSADFALTKEDEEEGPPRLIRNESGLSYLVTNIYVNESRYGKIVYYEAERPFSKGFRSLANYFCKFMEALTRNGLLHGVIGGKESTFLVELIEKPHVSRSWIRYQMNLNGWGDETPFRLIMLDGRFGSLSESAKAAAKERLAKCFPYGTLFETKSRLTCLLAGTSSSALDKDEIRKRALGAIPEKEICFGASMSFADLSRLRFYAEQCHHILNGIEEYGRLANEPQTRICFYNSDFFFFDFLKTYGIDTDYRWIIHPAIEKLALYDERNHMSNVTLLRTYIECGFNSKATAAALYLHQNSVLYRLDRIKEICKIDLKDHGETGPQLFHIYLSCKILEFDQMKNERDKLQPTPGQDSE